MSTTANTTEHDLAVQDESDRREDEAQHRRARRAADERMDAIAPRYVVVEDWEDSAAQRREIRDRVGRQHAEAALNHYSNEMGISFTDEQFERFAADLAQKISTSLQVARTHR